MDLRLQEERHSSQRDNSVQNQDLTNIMFVGFFSEKNSLDKKILRV